MNEIDEKKRQESEKRLRETDRDLMSLASQASANLVGVVVAAIAALIAVVRGMLSRERLSAAMADGHHQRIAALETGHIEFGKLLSQLQHTAIRTMDDPERSIEEWELLRKATADLTDASVCMDRVVVKRDAEVESMRNRYDNLLRAHLSSMARIAFTAGLPADSDKSQILEKIGKFEGHRHSLARALGVGLNGQSWEVLINEVDEQRMRNTRQADTIAGLQADAVMDRTLIAELEQRNARQAEKIKRLQESPKDTDGAAPCGRDHLHE